MQRTGDDGPEIQPLLGLPRGRDHDLRGWTLHAADTFEKVYGLARETAPMPLSQPGLVTIPLGCLVLVVVSLLTPALAPRL